MDERTAAAQIVAAGRRLGARGLISAGEGNLSIRLDGDRFGDHADAAGARTSWPSGTWS